MYKPGGRVVLNSGGPEMKVVEVVPHVVCEWTDAGGTTRRGTWPAACVRPANSTDAELAERGARTPFADPSADTALPGSDCSTPVTRGEVAGGLPRAEVRLRALIVGAVPMVKEFNRLDEAATGVPSARAMAWLGAVASELGVVDDGMRTVGVGAAAEVKQLADAPHVVGGRAVDRSPDDAPALARVRSLLRAAAPSNLSDADIDLIRTRGLLRAALRLVTGEPSRWPRGAWAEAARAELGDGGPAGEPYDYGPFLR